MPIERDDLPTPWFGSSQLGQLYFDMPLTLHPTTWCRYVEDFGRGFPAFHVEVAWIEDDNALHFATCAGFTFDENADGTDEREVLDRRRIPLMDIAGMTWGFGPGNKDVVRLANGESHDDWPGDLITAHRHQHPDAYRF